MAIIKKKTLPEYFNLVVSGKKKFDFRLNDFEIKEGDTLVLEEWDPVVKKYTGRKTERKVLYIKKFKVGESFWAEKEIMEKGIQIISLE